MKKQNSIIHPISKAKGLGSAKSGLHHFIHQRITAVFLIPLMIISTMIIMKATTLDAKSADELLLHPLSQISLSLSLIMAMYHGMLGMKVVIEDYVSCMCGRNTAIIIVYAVTIITIALGLYSIFNPAIVKI